MNNEINLATWRKYGLIVLSLLFVSAAGWWLARGHRSQSQAGRPVPTPDFAAFPDAQPSANTNVTAPRPDDVLLTLALDKLANAHLKIEAATATQPVQSVNATGGLRTTGTVQANAYKETPVLPLASGIVREVRVVLLGIHGWKHVRHRFSPECVGVLRNQSYGEMICTESMNTLLSKPLLTPWNVIV